MLSSLMLVLSISSIITVSSNDTQAKTVTNSCVLPPQPKNGHYEVLEPETPNLSPGDKVASYSIEVTCDPGFERTVGPVSSCEDGETFFPLTECLRQCSMVTTSVMSCGVGEKDQESKCIVPIQLADFTSREGPKPVVEEELNCGLTGPALITIIAGGRTAVKQELPWHAGIYTKTKRPYMQICGGSLVSQTVIISAAHCFWDEVEKQLPASNYAVAVGKLYRPWNEHHDENAQKSDVAEIKIPSRFQGSVTNLQDDIALVITSKPFEFSSSVSPICLDFNINLDKKQLETGNLGKVAGWGLTSDNGRASPVLQVAELPVVNIDECIGNSDLTFRSYITSDKICAGYQNGTSVCKGDSGGGLSFSEAVGGRTRYFLRGVVSAAPRNENLCNTFAWGTFTHVLKHEHFIQETVVNSATVAEQSTASVFS